MEKPSPIAGHRVEKSALINLERGKIPPQAVDLEEVVLGAMMIDKKGVDEVIDILHPDVFYKDSHKYIYEAIFKLFESSEPVDLLTVSSQLKKDGKLEAVGGDFYLIKLTQKVASSAHIEFHARIILQKYIQRSLIKISNDIIEDAYSDATDVFDLLDNAEAKLYEVTQGNLKRSAETAQNLVIQAKKRIEEISNKEGLSGIPSGFDKLDKLTSGWQPSDLIIVAARPGMGKTALTLSMARNIAVNSEIPVAFFSLEMSSVQLITRLISSETGLSSEKLRTGKLEKHEWEQLNVKVKTLEKAPLFIDDTPSLSIFDLRAKARRLASQHNIRLIVIDYLQLMTAGGSQKGGNREQEISTISRNLKALAKELNVPVIALSQLSRAVETRGGSKRPILSDLRESGAIEQDADIVSFIYRPEYYKIDEWDDEERTPTQGQAEFIVAKHRNGGLENIRLKFVGALGKFDNLDDFDSPFEFQSKMNADEENPFATPNLPSADDAFGSSMNSDDDPDDNDVPFKILQSMLFRANARNFTIIFFFLFLIKTSASVILVPMDAEGQKNHLKAYGITYWVLAKQQKVQWLLNYRGGSFMLPDGDAIRKECQIRGVSFEVLSDGQAAQILDDISSPSQNQDAVILEKAPKIAVYSPSGNQPWDDAVTMVLTYAEIPYTTIYDTEVLGDKLALYDWLHLHHEDFTGQYGRFYGHYRAAPWYIEDKANAEALAQSLGYSKVSDEKLAVALKIRNYVIGGGFMFAMCSATDSFDIALAAEEVDICEPMFDGDPSDANYQAKLDYSNTFAFTNFTLERNPIRYEFSSIDMTNKRANVPKDSDYFSLMEFSAKWDPVPTMLTQNHTSLVKGFMGQTTAYTRSQVKPTVMVLGENKINGEARYIHGIKGKGFFTFYGGHDPEDYQHRVGGPQNGTGTASNFTGVSINFEQRLVSCCSKKKQKT